MRAEETFDPPKNGGRVLLSNPGDCQQTTQKKDWSVVVLGSGKRGGVGNSFLIFGPSAWVACWAATQPIQRKEVLETPGPLFQTGKLFLIEGHEPSKLCPRFQFVELKANSAIT